MFPSRPCQLIPTGLTPVYKNRSIRSLVDRQYLAAPATIQQLYPCGYYTRLYLNISRGEPAISQFDWHITSNHKSSHRISPQTGTDLPPPFGDVHPAHGQLTKFRVFTSGHVCRLIQTRFPCAYAPKRCFRLPCKIKLADSFFNRHAIIPRSLRIQDSHCLLVIGFSIYFTPLIGVLFAFPSRYSFTIGQCACLVLDRDRPRFPQGLPCLVVLRCTLSGILVSDTGRSPFIVSCSKLFSYQNTHQISRVLQPPSPFQTQSFQKFLKGFSTFLQSEFSRYCQRIYCKGFVIN